MTGHFINSGYVKTGEPMGYHAGVIDQVDRGMFKPLKAIYRFQLNMATPLTFGWDGIFYQPDRNFDSDQGSVPLWAQRIVPKDRFLVGFWIHDSGYRHGGLHISTDGANYIFRQAKKSEIDYLLYEMVLADPCPGNQAIAYAIWKAVCIGGMKYGAGDLKKRKD